MSSSITRTIKTLKQIDKGVHPISLPAPTKEKEFIDRVPQEELRFLATLRDEGLIAFDPDNKINLGSNVRLTDRGKEHLLTLTSHGKYKAGWMLLGAVISGFITFIVKINTTP